MVSVSVAPTLLSATVTVANGLTAASSVVVTVGVSTVMVGAAASVSVTVTVPGLALVPAVLVSLSVNVVIVLEPGVPALGVNTSPSRSWLMVVAERRQAVDAAAAAGRGRCRSTCRWRHRR